MQKEIDTVIQNLNLPSYRTSQVLRAIYVDLVASFDEITTISKDLREKLSEKIDFPALTPITELVSKDENTIKVLFQRQHNDQKIEAVLMRHDDGRNTVCVSCMVGCPVGCSFCATGQMGFGGNLTADEIVEQVLYFARLLKTEGEKVTNVVYMGMGEPLLNLPALKDSLTILSEQFGLGKRRFTVSTSGYLPQLKDLIDWGYRGRIAVSLHASNQGVRAQLMPVAKAYPLDRLLAALFKFEELTGKRITYEYIMIDGVNDQIIHAEELGRLLNGHLAHVNLIPYNKIKGPSFEQSPSEHIRRFQKVLDKYGIPNTVRVTMGADVNAACGQLAAKQSD